MKIPPSQWIERLNLAPHPEGGFYREIYRSSFKCKLEASHDAERSLATCIYYLLPTGSFSAFHKLSSEETWSYIDGGAISIHIIDTDGRYRCRSLGVDVSGESDPVITIEPNCWFAAEPTRHADSLAACFVAPGFDFSDFTMARREELLRLCPSRQELISRLTLP